VTLPGRTFNKDSGEMDGGIAEPDWDGMTHEDLKVYAMQMWSALLQISDMPLEDSEVFNGSRGIDVAYETAVQHAEMGLTGGDLA